MQRCPIAGSFDEFTVLVSCCDYRTSRLTPNDAEKYIYIGRLRKRMNDGKVYIMHLSYLKPLSIYSLHASIRDPELAKKIVEPEYVENEDLGKWGVPHPYLVDRILVAPGGHIVFWWHWPPGVDMSDVYGWAERRGGYAVRGIRLPVYTCKPSPKPGDEEELGRTARVLLSVDTVKLAAPALAYILLAGLDRHRFIPLRKLANTAIAAAARDLEELYGLEEGTIRYKYILQYYYTLSNNYILGRYRVIDLQRISQGVSIAITLRDASFEEFELLYGLAAVVKRAGHIFYSPERGIVFAIMAGMTSAHLKRMYNLVDPRKLLVEIPIRIVGYSFPYELYNPFENRWEEKPVQEFMELLRKMGYIK